MEEKKEKVSDLELLCYIYDKGVDDDIMELANEIQKKVLNIMDDKIKKIMENEEEQGFAVTEEYWQREKEFYGQDERREGRVEGIVEGKAELAIKLIKSKFELSQEMEQMIYKLNSDDIENIVIHNQQINSEEELMQFIKSI